MCFLTLALKNPFLAIAIESILFVVLIFVIITPVLFLIYSIFVYWFFQLTGSVVEHLLGMQKVPGTISSISS